MPILLLLLVALAVGAAVDPGRLALSDGRDRPDAPDGDGEEKVGHALAQHSRLRRLLMQRLDPAVATGLALTLALATIVVGGLVLAVLAYLVRSSDQLVADRRERRRMGLRPRVATSRTTGSRW